MAVVLNTGLNTAERFYEKSKNNVKYGTAAALAGGTYLAVKSKTARKAIGSTIGYTGGKIADVFSWIGKKIGIKFGDTSVGKTVTEYATKIKNSETVKTATDAVRTAGQKVAEQCGKISASSFGQTIKKGISFVAEKLTPLVNKIPKKGILGAVAVAAGLALIAISHKHGYNSGKIDQKYADKQELINRFQI